MESQQQIQKFKILLVGQSAVGKTTMLFNYIYEEYNNSNRKLPTIGIDFMHKLINVQGQCLELHIWDTAGQQRFRKIISQFFKNSKGALVIFDLCSIRTLKQCRYWFNQLEQHCGKIPIVLVGNKLDQFEIKQTKDHIQEIRKEIQQLRQMKEFEYFQTSAFTGKNIKAPFQHLGKMIFYKWKEEDKKFKKEFQFFHRKRQNNLNQSLCKC